MLATLLLGAALVVLYTAAAARPAFKGGEVRWGGPVVLTVAGSKGGGPMGGTVTGGKGHAREAMRS